MKNFNRNYISLLQRRGAVKTIAIMVEYWVEYWSKVKDPAGGWLYPLISWNMAAVISKKLPLISIKYAILTTKINRIFTMLFSLAHLYPNILFIWHPKSGSSFLLWSRSNLQVKKRAVPIASMITSEPMMPSFTNKIG